MTTEYVYSENFNVQGEYSDVYKKYGKEYQIYPLGKGNGNWNIVKRSDAIIDGVSYRDFVLSYYGKSRLTKKLFDKFLTDIEAKKIKL